MKHLFLILFLILTCGFVCLHTSAGETRKIVIFQTTDQHGTIGDDTAPGILQIAEGIRKKRADNPGTSLWIDCGDLTVGTLSATFDQGASMISALNAAGCDIFVPGNHDFEYGRETLIRNLKAFRGTVLGANLKVEGYDGVKPWILVERGPVRIAVIGIVPPYLRVWMESSLLQGIKLASAESALAKYMPAILDAKPHIIILAIHLGEYTSAPTTGTKNPFSLELLSFKYPQINLMLCGHTHQTIRGKRFFPGKGAWLVQAPALGKDAAQIEVELEKDESDMKIVNISSEFLGINEQSPKEKNLQKLLEPIRKKENEFAAKKVAKVKFDLMPMVDSNTPCKLAEELCHAMCEATKADAAFSSSISNYKKNAGNLTERNLFKLIPRNNRVISRKLTPAQIRAIVKELKAKYSDSSNWMTWTGFTISSDNKEEIISLKTGKTIPEDAEISVAFNSYAASGAGGRYPELAKIIKTAHVFQKDLPDLRDVFRTYLKKHYPSSENQNQDK